MALSEIQIKKAKAAERPYKLADGEGLFLLVQKNGSKLWRLKYRYHGKEKLLSFGAYPEVGIAAARELKRAAKGVLAEGRDPMVHKPGRDFEEAKTFRAIATMWHENRASSLNPAHAKRVYGAISDIERQAHVYAELQDAWYQVTPDTIRRMVLDATVRGSDPRAVLVGRDAYLAAGGRIERELFDDEASESWIDVALLEDLAQKAMDDAAKRVAEEHGLAWVRPTLGNYVSHDLVEGLNRLPCEPAPLTEEGRTGAVTREPTGPGPGHRTRSFAAAFAGVRTLCVVFIQTQIRLNNGRELDARASEGSVGKCLRERSDHDHWISPRNGEQNWHTVRSGCCNARRGIASRIHENSPIPSSVPDAAQLLARPCRVGTDPFNLLKSCVNFPFSYTPCCGLEWHLPFEG
jgi:hypothetical protein